MQSHFNTQQGMLDLTSLDTSQCNWCFLIHPVLYFITRVNAGYCGAIVEQLGVQ